MSRRLLLWLAATVLALSQSPAVAHRLDADYTRTDQGFRIEFFTGDGAPASDLRVTAQSANNPPIEIGRTDEKGVITFAPPSPGEWTIVGTGDGHSTSRNPLKINVGAATPAAVANPTTRQSDADHQAAPARAQRGAFPWLETIISLAFIAVLTAATLLMMRRSAQLGHRHSEMDIIAHEVAHLRTEVSELRTTVAELKAERELRA